MPAIVTPVDVLLAPPAVGIRPLDAVAPAAAGDAAAPVRAAAVVVPSSARSSSATLRERAS